ncbi:hypothetical protein AJ80_05618 [Polytolypa hystricis UAMH7299]|uniref:Uncharacterized protein n=1 Tax=Polytolypa hystricis (strain UAMH7299) TaxID=1447883 RepID=A0A2B7Y243_POLH7|nr:hypothetical protein AJ80_05618 [Polytolypa hystricis UAMH7299]
MTIKGETTSELKFVGPCGARDTEVVDAKKWIPQPVKLITIIITTSVLGLEAAAVYERLANAFAVLRDIDVKSFWIVEGFKYCGSGAWMIVWPNREAMVKFAGIQLKFLKELQNIVLVKEMFTIETEKDATATFWRYCLEDPAAIYKSKTQSCTRLIIFTYGKEIGMKEKVDLNIAARRYCSAVTEDMARRGLDAHFCGVTFGWQQGEGKKNTRRLVFLVTWDTDEAEKKFNNTPVDSAPATLGSITPNLFQTFLGPMLIPAACEMWTDVASLRQCVINWYQAQQEWALSPAGQRAIKDSKYVAKVGNLRKKT